MSTSIEVTCSECNQIIGDQFKPGDGMALYVAHRPECDPDLSDPAVVKAIVDDATRVTRAEQVVRRNKRMAAGE
jgi:hypothetical protein